MQKSLAFAAVLGALIIALALVYHARQLALVSQRMQLMEQRTSDLDTRLEKLSADLPVILEQAGNNAGRQAVRGIVDEVVQLPKRLLTSAQPPQGTNSLGQTSSPPSSLGGFLLDPAAPWVKFDIRQPRVRIEILPNLKEAPVVSVPHDSGQRATQPSNVTGMLASPTPAAEVEQSPSR